jgi:hypothetical protein
MKGRDETERIPYLRVGTTILKRVLMPLSNGRNVETLIPWNVETLRQDYSKDYLAQVPKYDGFCTIPSHTDYHREIHGFLNRYEPISTVPAEGEFPHIRDFLGHIFGQQIELGLDYLQLLYLRPLQRLPIVLLVVERTQHGKDHLSQFPETAARIPSGLRTYLPHEAIRPRRKGATVGKWSFSASSYCAPTMSAIPF